MPAQGDVCLNLKRRLQQPSPPPSPKRLHGLPPDKTSAPDAPGEPIPDIEEGSVPNTRGALATASPQALDLGEVPVSELLLVAAPAGADQQLAASLEDASNPEIPEVPLSEVQQAAAPELEEAAQV